MKKIINISLTLLLSIVLITGCGKKITNSDNQNNEQKENQENQIITENTKIIGSQTIGSLTFKIMSLKYENEVSILEYSITNEENEETIIPLYKLMLSDDNGIIYEFEINHKNNILESSKTRKIKKEIQKDLTKVTSITFELIEE